MPVRSAWNSPHNDIVYRGGSVRSCAQQINLNRPIGMYLGEVEDVRKRELYEFEYDALGGNPGAPRSRLRCLFDGCLNLSFS
jgi:hypothetical protein